MTTLTKSQYEHWLDQHGVGSLTTSAAKNTADPLDLHRRSSRDLVRILEKRLGIYVGLIPIALTIAAGIVAMFATMSTTSRVIAINDGRVASISERAAHQMKMAKSARTVLSMLAEAPSPDITVHQSAYRISDIDNQTIHGSVRAVWSRNNQRRTTSARVTFRVENGTAMGLKVEPNDGTDPYIRTLATFSFQSSPASK